ncbi:MAG: L,D-transpeptidase [Gemmatimonadales bacterium]
MRMRFLRKIFLPLAVFSLSACAPRVSIPDPEIEPMETPRELGIDDISVGAVNAAPTSMLMKSEMGPVVVRTQILLDRARFSVGVIDGKASKNTALALYWLQKSQNLPTTTTLDSATYNRLLLLAGPAPVVVRVVVDAEMLKGPFVTISKNVYEQEDLRCLCYQSVSEMLAERYHSTIEVMRKLNPGVGFAGLEPGDSIWVPAVEVTTTPTKKIARIQISKKGNYVHALAADGTLLYHFPSTLGSRYDPSPDGHFRVTGIAWDPVFRYDPMLFSDVPDQKPKAKLPPGPNSPVGKVWIALSKEHVGIHGTPNPETIGYASSHGCVRLTNWDATRLARSTQPGTPVEFTL